MSKIFTITEGLENMGALRTGGQGSVYKGRRMGPVISAVKLLPTPIYTEDKDDKNFKAFKNEVDKLKKVNEVPNPNVVKILNSGLTDSGSFPFIEMEFIDGPDLEELLKPPHDKLFTVKEAMKLADQLANALAHCHKVGVKHGDIKSNNVKYNLHSGNYVLLDFGLAIMSDEQRRTSMRHAGAIEFMAPEQNTGALLFETDIYSYGVILYELLAGQVPFPLQDNGETSRNNVMVAHMETPVPNLMQLRKDNIPANWPAEKKALEMRVPQWLLDIISKCLEKDPEKRYANGMALQQAIIDGSVEAIKASDDMQASEVIIQSDESVKEPAVLPQQAYNDDTVHLSKPLFIGMLLLLLLSMAAAGYLYFTGNRTAAGVVKTEDSTSVPKTDTTTTTAPRQSFRQRQKAADSVTQQAIKDEMRRQRQKAEGEQADSTETDTSGTVKPPDE
ncbi:serine/threonine protein kinase [Mucilaginibacter sp. AW1-3]